nr:hypothetical protein JVH1_1079 [Rhodococcus sp. JVH1]
MRGRNGSTRSLQEAPGSSTAGLSARVDAETGHPWSRPV